MAVSYECLGRTPFASLLAAIIVVIGTCVFCGTSYKGLQLMIVGVFNNLFSLSVNWLEILQVMFVIIGAVMGAIALVLLIFGCLATGATRSNIYSGARCIMGGRVSAAFFIVLSYILTLGWLAVMCVAMVPVILYASMTAICDEEIYNHSADELKGYCFNITRFGVYPETIGTQSLCQYPDLKTLCDKTSEAGPLFCIALGAVALIVIGMIHFLITLGANYTRINISRELTDYRDAVEMEELDLHSSGADKRGPPPYRDNSISI